MYPFVPLCRSQFSHSQSWSRQRVALSRKVERSGRIFGSFEIQTVENERRRKAQQHKDR